MKPMTGEWVTKAEGDYSTAQRERDAEPEPNYDAAVFHAPQCWEKYLKARLVEADVDFPKTHDLAAVLDLCLTLEPGWESLRESLNALTDMGVEVRYPGTFADADGATRSLATAANVREAVRLSLQLKT